MKMGVNLKLQFTNEMIGIPQTRCAYMPWHRHSAETESEYIKPRHARRRHKVKVKDFKDKVVAP